MNINDTTMICIDKDKVDLNSSKSIIQKAIKRTIDIFAGLVGAIILIPLCLIVKIVNIISKDNDPLFFVQERIGKNGKLFKMYKFRTMIVGAEEQLEELLRSNDSLRKEYEENKKIKDDPRITKCGGFLRKTSLDEFPQLINVLKGDMTLVGPRPYLTREIKDMGEAYEKIITLRPGLTGLWQISGRSDLTFDDRVKLDEEYYRTRSLVGDIKIFFKTIKIVLFRKGAL